MEFQDNLIQYVFSLMCQYEARFYNLFVEQQSTLKIPVSLMKMSYVCPLIGNLTSQYLNECYKAIILKNNNGLLEPFTKIKDSESDTKHSYMCILQLVAGLISAFHKYMDRTTFDISSYDNYMKSFEKEFHKYYSNNIEYIRQKLNHTCDLSEDISKLDPNEKIFYSFKDKDEENEYNKLIAGICVMFENIKEETSDVSDVSNNKLKKSKKNKKKKNKK